MQRVLRTIAVVTTAVVVFAPGLASAQVDGGAPDDPVPAAPDESEAAPGDPAPTVEAVELPASPETLDEIADAIVEQIEATVPPAEADQTAEQTTIVAGTSTASATTGSNDLVEETPVSTAGGDGGAAIDTGRADAVGSRDRTDVNQEVTVVLGDDAAADVVQISLVFNIGAALANSGWNAVTADGTTGRQAEINTGAATAIGNDVSSYLTQGATADASDGSSRATSQVTISLRLGVAVADTGQNSISGSATAGGGGGSIGSGAASAIGNDSITEITQRASAVGSGSARLSIEQRATVINLGWALANSGVNEIQGIAGSLLSTPSDDLAGQLFELLLPALIESHRAGSGAGGVATGDATAIGNRSQTYIEQSAVAAAAGDGSATIRQDLVVANTGAAVANTGGNTLGGGLTRPAIDERTAAVVADLASFLAELLGRIDQSGRSTSQDAETSRSGRSIPFGDLLIGIDGTVGSSTTQLGAGDGTRARIRQVTAIVSVGIASADTGNNNAVVIVTDETLTNATAATLARQFVSESTSSITTGNAAASNVGLVIVCQRSDAPNVVCLGPPATPPAEPPAVDPSADTPAGTPTRSVTVPNRPALRTPVDVARPPATLRQPGGQLPATGTDIGTLLAIASGLLVAGLLIVRVTRRPAA